MSVKLLVLFIASIVGLFILIKQKKPLYFLFWLGVSLTFIRRLSVPIIDEINISFAIFTALILFKPAILFCKFNFKEWRLWYLVFAIGIINTFIFSQNEEWFIGTDVISKAYNWGVKFLVIIFVSSCVVYFVKTKDDLSKLMNLFMLSCFVFSFTATMAYFGFYDGVVIYGEGSLRDAQDLSKDIIYSEIYGISPSNLVFGISALAIVFVPYLKWQKWQKYILMILVIFAVIISLKRLAILCLIVTLFYYLIIETKRGNNIWLLIILILILFAGSTYYGLIYKRFFSAINTMNSNITIDNSSDIRLIRYKIAYDAFLESPIFGKGLGYLTFIHNGFIEILGNLGMLGLIIFKPIISPLSKIRTNFYNPWAISLIIMMLTLVMFEAAINRVEIMYYLGLLYGGYLVSVKLN